MKRRFNNRGLTLDPVSYSHLKGRLDVEAVLESLGIDIAFRPRPNQIMCHCPDLVGNHENGDANPSFGVREEELIYNCFVCGGGNIIELVQMMKPEYARRYDNDFAKDQEAVTYLEQFADFNMEIDLPGRIDAILHPTIDEAPAMPEYPDSLLFKFRKIHPYLYERGLSEDIIKEMHVGFDEEHCGIIIPHYFQGKLRGWQTRHLAQDENGGYICEYCDTHQANSQYGNKKLGKYKNTKHFPGSNTLYGYDRLKKYLQEEDGESVIVVESPMTALKLMSMGFNRVVATFGQFNREQAMLILAIPTVYFWPDNDKAGWENTERCVQTLGQYTTVKIVPVLPNLKGDAADLDTAEEVSRYLQNAWPASLFKLYAKDKKLPKLDELLSLSAH